MKLKRIISLLLITLCLLPLTVQAEKTEMYIGGTYVVRDLEVIDGFDMLPILDIANELGYSAQFNGTTAILTGNKNSYTFTLHNPAVYDNNGREYGLDIVPQMIDGKLMIPAKFLVDHLHLSYTWDDITGMIFINSNPTYKWLVNTNEYKQERARRNVLGEWIYEKTDYWGDKEYISVTFSNDGSCIYKTSKEKSFGTFRFTDPYHIAVDLEVCKRNEYEPTYAFTSRRTNYFEFSYNTLKETGYISATGTTSTGRTFYNHKALMYRPDATVVVNKYDIASYISAGWYTKPVCYVHALDGRKEMIYEEDFPAWKGAGWYGSTNIRLYKIDSYPTVSTIWNLDKKLKEGWTTYPVVIMFDQAGVKHKVPVGQRHQRISEGWYYPETLSLGKTYDQIRVYFGTLTYYGTKEGSPVYKSDDGFKFVIPKGYPCIEVQLPLRQLFPEVQFADTSYIPYKDIEIYSGMKIQFVNRKYYIYYPDRTLEIPYNYNDDVYIHDWVRIYNY